MRRGGGNVCRPHKKSLFQEPGFGLGKKVQQGINGKRTKEDSLLGEWHGGDGCCHQKTRQGKLVRNAAKAVRKKIVGQRWAKQRGNEILRREHNVAGGYHWGGGWKDSPHTTQG